MPPDIIPPILGGLTEAIVGAVLGFVFAFLLFRLQRSRKVVEYDVISMPLLSFKPGTAKRPAVTVDKSILTGNIDDVGENAQIHTAYGFEIELFNTGNESIENPVVEVMLDNKARIIDYETIPEHSRAYDIEAEKDQDNAYVLRIKIPYLNKRDHILVRVMSTQNGSRKCSVHTFGLGIISRPYRAGGLAFRPLVGLVASMMLYLLVVGLAPFHYEPLLPRPVLVFLGGTFSSTVVYAPPLWFHVVVLSAVALLLIACLLRMLLVTTLQERRAKRGWDWKGSHLARIPPLLRPAVRFLAGRDL